MTKFITFIPKMIARMIAKMLANWRRPEYQNKAAWQQSIIFLLLMYMMVLIFNTCNRGHPERYKVTQGIILGVGRGGTVKSPRTYSIIRVRYAYNNKYIETTTGGTDFEEEINRNISKFRRKRVLIAFDTLYTDNVEILLTDEQYKRYGLVQPDSLKWFNYAEQYIH